MGYFDLFLVRRRKSVRFRQQILKRALDERQWGAKFMADVAKERCFGSINFCERFIAFPLDFVCTGVCDHTGNLSGHQLKKRKAARRIALRGLTGV